MKFVSVVTYASHSGYLDFFKYLCSMGMPDIFVKSSFFFKLKTSLSAKHELVAHFWVNYKFLLAFSCNPFLETDILFLATIDSIDIKLTLKYWASSPRMQPTLRQSPYDGHLW